jgi:hypothetical protein
MTDDPAPLLPFGSALLEAIKRISDQLLLYVLAGAIIVAASAAWGPQLVVPLVALLLAGLVAWTVLQAARVRAGKPTILQNVRLGPFTKVTGGIKRGDVRTGAGGDRIEQNTTLGPGSKVEDGITYGDIDTRER